MQMSLLSDVRNLVSSNKVSTEDRLQSEKLNRKEPVKWKNCVQEILAPCLPSICLFFYDQFPVIYDIRSINIFKKVINNLDTTGS